MSALPGPGESPTAAAAAATTAPPTASPTASPWRRDLGITLISLLLLLAWDFSGGDLAAARLFGGPGGFAARDTWWASTLLHDGGRWLAWLVLGWLLLSALVSRAVQRSPIQPGPNQAERWFWIGVILVCALAVPALKRFSLSSCPWDLAEFGGVARYVSHWQPGLTDGGSGHCFPSGHAVAAFAFFGLYFQWRPYRPARARAWLWAVLWVGAAFGLAQLARGAHYPSHTLWSAWLCWALSALAAAGLRLRLRR